MKKKTKTRTARGNVRLDIGYQGEERPPIPASKLNRIEADISDRLSRLKNEGVAATDKCSGTYCYDKVQVVKQAFAGFGVNLRCAASKCSWVKVNGKWTRVCTLDCKDGKLLVQGNVT